MNNIEILYLLESIKETLGVVFDALESTTDSDIDHFEDDEEEMECAPVQYSARKVFEVMQKIDNAMAGI